MVFNRLKKMFRPGLSTLKRPQPERFVPPRGTVATQWEAYYEFQLRHGGYRPLLDGALDPFRDWNPDICYSWRVEADLTCVLDLKYVGKEPETAAALLARALAVAERSRADSERANFSAHDMLRLHRGEAYARWIATNTLDRPILGRAHQLALQVAGVRAYDDDGNPHDAELANTFVREGALLSAARIALIVGQPDWAMTLLQDWRGGGNNFHDEICHALKRSAQTLLNASDDRMAAHAAISSIFDQLRPPMPKRAVQDFSGDLKLTAFELGVIRAQLEGEDSKPIELGAVYRAVAAP
jgi:hypothetical protein